MSLQQNREMNLYNKRNKEILYYSILQMRK